MNPISSTALSGLNAASLQLQSSAHNIANAMTPGFRRQLVSQTADPAGGVRVRSGVLRPIRMSWDVPATPPCRCAR